MLVLIQEADLATHCYLLNDPDSGKPWICKEVRQRLQLIDLVGVIFSFDHLRDAVTRQSAVGNEIAEFVNDLEGNMLVSRNL